MSATDALRKLGTFLFWLAIAIFAGTIVELAATKHWQEPVQLIPFAACAIGLIALVVAYLRPTRATQLALRSVMAAVTVVSLIGVWEHLEGNAGFVREMHPKAAGLDLWIPVLTGRAPIGASGILAIGALLALASTWTLVVVTPDRAKKLELATA